MAATGFTPISLYYTTTALAVPVNTNLVAGELALNTTDGKLFYKDTSGSVQLLGTKGGVGSSTDTQVLYNSSELVVGSANMTFDGTTLTTNALNISGGTANGVAYLNGTKVLTTGSALTFDGTNLTVPAEVYRNSDSSYMRLAGGNPAATGASVLMFGATHATAAGRLVLNTSGTGYMEFDLNSSEKMRLDSTGLGIGTSSPVVKLDVNGSINLANGSNLSWGGTYASGKPSIYADATSGYIAFAPTGVTGAERMRLDSSGNLGIGTNTPAAKLDVTNGSVRLSNGFEVGFGATNTTFWLGDSINNWHRWYTSGAEQMRLTSTGLGIGTSSPTEKLTIAGNIKLGISGTSFIYGPSTTGRSIYSNSDTTAYITAYGSAYGSGLSSAFQFVTGTTNVTTLDSAGNLGLGVTPSAWSGIGKTLQINTGGAISADTANTYFSSNSYYNGSNWIYQTTNNATRYTMATNFHAWYTAPSGTAGNPITFTQAMTLDASGNLAVGRTAATTRLHLKAASDGADVLQIQNSSETQQLYLGVSADGPYVFVAQSQALRFGTGNTERARIDSSGNLLVGTTTNYTSSKLLIAGDSYTSSSTTNQGTTGWAGVAQYGIGSINISRNGSNVLAFYHTTNASGLNGTAVGTVSITTSATAYNTGSDYRLKNITGPITTSGAYIDSLKPVEGTWKVDGSTFVGLIAHETQEASRTTVATGTKDGEEMQGMDYSSAEIIANLIAELQSLRARVAQLEAK